MAENVTAFMMNATAIQNSKTSDIVKISGVCVLNGILQKIENKTGEFDDVSKNRWNGREMSENEGKMSEDAFDGVSWCLRFINVKCEEPKLRRREAKQHV